MNVRDRHHFHSCGKCGFIWDHDPPGLDVSLSEFRKMHSCGLCGAQENCAIALEDASAAAEFAVHDRVTTPEGRVLHAPSKGQTLLARLLGVI